MRSAAWCALVAGLLCLAGSACSTTDSPEPPRVAPLAAPPIEEPPPSAPPRIDPADTDPNDTDPIDTDLLDADPAEPPGDPEQSWHDVVDEVLDRYAAVLTQLVADPAALDRPGDDMSERWRGVVVDGALSDAITARARERLAVDRMVILPGPDGIAYRHVAVDVEQIGAGERPDHLSFTWCGHSPGVGVHVDSGVVLDDAVSHSRGTGTIRRVDDGWKLETLDQFDLVLLAPGVGDPCR